MNKLKNFEERYVVVTHDYEVIKGQMETAKRNQEMFGESLDEIWYKKANAALAHKGKTMFYLKCRIKKIKDNTKHGRMYASMRDYVGTVIYKKLLENLEEPVT
tara:strand:- start:3733 stop:4041 length:309 start_codon:yes stop_codon:yes gene_type:complete